MGNVDNFAWITRLLFNLYGYSTILLPVGIIVYMVKHKHCLPSFSNLTLIRLIVYGKDVNSVTGGGGGGDIEQSRSLLINEKKEFDDKPLIDSDGSVDGTGGIGGQANRREKIILFFTCFFGLHCSYLIWGVYQEKIMTTEYLLSINSTQFLKKINDAHFPSLKGDKIKFHDSQFLVLTGRIFALAFSSIAFIYTQSRKSNTNQSGSSKRFVIAPIHEFFYCSLSNILSSWCQYEALKYVNFPTQVLSKACKIPSVMLMSRLVSNKKYDLFEYLVSLFISFGMIIFLHGNHNVHPSSPSTKESDNSTDSQSINTSAKLANGLIVLALYLLFDSFTSNWEENIFHKYRISSWQMMVTLNLCSIILTLTSLTEQGNLVPALITITSCNQLFRDVLYMAFSSTIGQFFVFYTISNFGALIFTMIMTLRQIFAILLSFIIYHHSISIESILGITIVFTAIISLRFVKINKIKK